jgi:hypothetical protein
MIFHEATLKHMVGFSCTAVIVGRFVIITSDINEKLREITRGDL